jgi:hypothetical protein
VEGVLLVLRVVSGSLLLLFLAALFVMMWRDFRVISFEISTRTRPQGHLVVINTSETGPKTGSTFPLLPLTSLGRSPTNTIVLEDAFISGEHATITLRSGRWWLEDRGSSNGTQLNGYRIRESVIVSTGDIISVGQIDLKLELE